MPNPNMRLYIYYKMHGAQEDFPKLTSRWLPKGTGNVFILLFTIVTLNERFKVLGDLTLKRGTGRAANKTPFSRSLSSSLRPQFSYQFSRSPFQQKLQIVTKFAILESNFTKISVPQPQTL